MKESDGVGRGGVDGGGGDSSFSLFKNPAKARACKVHGCVYVCGASRRSRSEKHSHEKGSECGRRLFRDGTGERESYAYDVYNAKGEQGGERKRRRAKMAPTANLTHEDRSWKGVDEMGKGAGRTVLRRMHVRMRARVASRQ